MVRAISPYISSFPEGWVAHYKFCELCGTALVVELVEKQIRFNKQTGKAIDTLFWGCPNYQNNPQDRNHSCYLFYRDRKDV